MTTQFRKNRTFKSMKEAFKHSTLNKDLLPLNTVAKLLRMKSRTLRYYATKRLMVYPLLIENKAYHPFEFIKGEVKAIRFFKGKMGWKQNEIVHLLDNVNNTAAQDIHREIHNTFYFMQGNFCSHVCFDTVKRHCARFIYKRLIYTKVDGYNAEKYAKILMKKLEKESNGHT